MQEHKLSAIMFTDIVGYTALMGKNERKAYDMIHRNRRIQQALINKYQGTLLKEMGDGILASFPAATKAVHCAIAIQQNARKEEIPLRVGIHEGEVLVENNDVFGDGVNIASRIEQATESGCISISETVFHDIKNKPEIITEFLGTKTFKGVEKPIGIYKVLYDKYGTRDHEPKEDITVKNTGWKRKYSIITILILIVAILLFMIPDWLDKPSPDLERSIAVLPFDNESEDENNIYFVNGMMEDIRNNLAKIGDLRVISKTSTEKYRDSGLAIKKIAEELDVNFILEGTVQKAGTQVKIHAQLIEPETDDHIWVDTYERDLSNIFSVQSEIAEAIARELYAVITPGELEIIEKVPTSSITAYDIFLRAREHHNNYLLDYNKMEDLQESIILYRRALEYDSTFAKAYTGLALAYWNKNYWQNYFDETFLDSVISLTNIALAYDDQLDEAYLVRGMCYSNQINGTNKALKDYNTALRINPNFAQVYHQKSNIYAWEFEDLIEAIKNRHIAVKLDQSAFLPIYLRQLGDLYSNTGINEKAREYYSEAFALDNDSATYCNSLTYQLLSEKNIPAAFENAINCYHLDSTRIEIVVPVILFSSILGKDDLAYKYAMKLIELYEAYNIYTPNDWHRIGFAMWKMGKTDEAYYYFDEQEKWCLESIKLNKWYGRMYAAHYDVAGIYALKGETEKAFKYLNEINNKHFFSQWWVSQIKYDPFFDSIRSDERFRKLLKDMETKYQHEHERVQNWLKEEGNL